MLNFVETARLTSKGQLVIPKRIRDAVRAGPGTEFKVHLEGSRIILEASRPRDRKASDWKGLNPKGRKLSDKELCAPVELGLNDGRH